MSEVLTIWANLLGNSISSSSSSNSRDGSGCNNISDDSVFLHRRKAMLIAQGVSSRFPVSVTQFYPTLGGNFGGQSAIGLNLL